MFDSIHGTLLRREPTRAVVTAGGIGYEIHVPLSTYEALPAAGQVVDLLLQPVVREDEWRLFGFASPGERNVFRALLRVTGVGPVMALGLLSGLTPQAFRSAVGSGDLSALTRVKGVGRKTAERIVVELRDTFASEAAAPGEAPVGAVAGPSEDAVRALVALGLDHGEARRRVDAQASRLGEAGVAELVRAALQG
ncbi:MAG: Holliday junction branch migration protein RuvA [Planctomycetota bacterium]